MRMRVGELVRVFACLMLSAGCASTPLPGSSPDGAAPRTDAGSNIDASSAMDAATSRPDAATPRPDAAPDPDADIDAGADAGLDAALPPPSDAACSDAPWPDAWSPGADAGTPHSCTYGGGTFCYDVISGPFPSPIECSPGSAAYSAEPCPSAGRVGRCTTRDAGLVYVTNFYAPYTTDISRSACRCYDFEEN